MGLLLHGFEIVSLSFHPLGSQSPSSLGPHGHEAVPAFIDGGVMSFFSAHEEEILADA